MFQNLNFIEQVLTGFFLIILFLVNVALIGFLIYLAYVRITNMLMFHKWLKRQLYEEPQKNCD